MFFQGAQAFESAVGKEIPIESNGEFSFSDDQMVKFTLRPLKEELRSIDPLMSAQAVGVVYLGKIQLNEPTSALSALRTIAVQVSKALDLDMALVTDSKTSTQMAPNELLLLYHPQVVITLALTRSVNDERYDIIGTYAITAQNERPADSADQATD